MGLACNGNGEIVCDAQGNAITRCGPGGFPAMGCSPVCAGEGTCGTICSWGGERCNENHECASLEVTCTGSGGGGSGGAAGSGGGGSGGAAGDAGSSGATGAAGGQAGSGGSGWPCPPDDDPTVETILCSQDHEIAGIAVNTSTFFLAGWDYTLGAAFLLVIDKETRAWPATPMLTVQSATFGGLQLSGDRVFWEHTGYSPYTREIRSCPVEGCVGPGKTLLSLGNDFLIRDTYVFDGGSVFFMDSGGISTCPLDDCSQPSVLVEGNMKPDHAGGIDVDGDSIYFHANDLTDTIYRIPRQGLSAGESPAKLTIQGGLVAGVVQLAVLDGWIYREGRLSGDYEGQESAMAANSLTGGMASETYLSGFGLDGEFGTFMKDPKGMTFLDTGSDSKSLEDRSSLLRCSPDGCAAMTTLASRSDGTYQALAADDDYLYVTSSQRSMDGKMLLWSRVQRVKK